MTTAVVFPGIPGLAVRVGRSLQRWGERAAQPIESTVDPDAAHRAWTRERFVADRRERDAIARCSVQRPF
ncbi:hypothetical protein BH11ACT3_BH11ACT3_15420 [soil metagenome]